MTIESMNPYISPAGDKYWYDHTHKIIDRRDGPAIERATGTMEWWVNGERHREDGPAIEWFDGSKEWYLNDKRHRADGPAIEYGHPDMVDDDWYHHGRELDPLEIFLIQGKQKG